MCSSPQCPLWRSLRYWQRSPDISLTGGDAQTPPAFTPETLNDAFPDLLCWRNPLPNSTQSPLKQMVKDHPDAPKQFGIRISDEVMELVAEIQEHRKLNSQPFTLAAVVESAIKCHYARLVKEGAIEEEDVL